MGNGVQIPIRPLIAFNQTLGNFSKQLDECLKDMDNAIKTLGNDWKDDKYSEFQAEFNQHSKKLQPLSDELKRVKKHSEEHWIPLIQEFLKKSVK